MSYAPKRPRYLAPHDENQTPSHDAQQQLHLPSIDCHSKLHDASESESTPNSPLAEHIAGLNPQPPVELLLGSEDIAETEPLHSLLESKSSSPLKSTSSSSVKSTSSSSVKSISSSASKCISSSPVESASPLPVESASPSPVKSASPSTLKSASSLTLKSEPSSQKSVPSSPLNLVSSSPLSAPSSSNTSLEYEVVAFPEHCKFVTQQQCETKQVVCSQLNVRPQPVSECSQGFEPDCPVALDQDVETDSEASVYETDESESDISGSEQPEQELREILSLMTVDDESNEFDPEEYVYETSASVEGDPPLYEGASVTFHESIVSILTFALSFRLTGVCLKALLDLISLHLPKSASIFKTSLSAFKNYFAYIQGPKAFKYYCSNCFKELSPNSKCSVCKKSKSCYLVKLSIHEQLQSLFQRPGFYSKLQFDHGNQVPGKYSDIYSGKLYQDLLQNNTLRRDVISFQWYTDGAALYSSSKMSVWPVYLSINELPYAERFKKENLLVPVIWCGPVKPLGNILVEEMYEDLKSLHQGEEFNVNGKEKKIIKGFLLNGTGDTPARSLMLNMVQFNGASSCQVCEQEGEGRPDCSGVRLFPYTEDDMIPRSLTSMEKYGEQGTELKPVKGVKGPCSLASVMPNYLLGTAVDPMHQLFGGVNKKILLLLLSTKKEAKKWSISKDQSVLDDRILNIKPPAHVTRLPRSLKEVHYWKISEWKRWLNDYSLPGVLSDQYMLHHASLVAAAQLLNADEVLSEALTIDENLLKKYVSQFSDFYHPDYLTMNFHLLLHLPSIVALQGPGWVYTCFPLESINGVILNLVHGTRWAEKQIATSVQTCLALPEIVSKLPDKSEAKQFCSKIMNRRKYQGAEVVDGSAIIGKTLLINHEELPPDIVSALKSANIKYRRLKQFHSLKRGKFLYVALSSKVSVCRNSSAAVYKTCNESNVGLIETFLRVYDCDCIDCSCDSKIITLVKKCEVLTKFKTLIPDVYVPNVAEYKKTDNYEIVFPASLQGVCTIMKINQKLYISKPTNTMEVE